MIDGVDVGVDHGGCLCISPCNNHKSCVQNVRLQPKSNQPPSMLCCGDKNLATHMTALLCTWLLVLYVDACGSILDEHLAQFHCCSDPTMASVRISNDGVQVVNNWCFRSLLGCPSATLQVLLPIVE